MIIKELVKTRLNGRCIEYYENLGYTLPKRLDKQGKEKYCTGEYMEVYSTDLMNSSDVEVRVICDICGDIVTIMHKNYYKTTISKNYDNYVCKNCTYERIKNTMYERYNAYNSMQIPKFREKQNSSHRHPIEYVRASFVENNFIPLFDDADYINRTTKLKCACVIHNDIIQEKNLFSMLDKDGCGICSNRIIVKGLNDIGTTHPKYIKYFFNIEDAYKNTYGGDSKKCKFICPDCGHTKKMFFSTLASYGFSCPKCGDGISYSEKFVFEFLLQTNNHFITQANFRNFTWCKKKIYDFYIPHSHCIIETHGLQHYEETNGVFGRTLAEEQENDIYKEKLAKDNGIKSYISLDCRKSEMEWIKNSIINSELFYILNLKEDDIDWLKCHKATFNSKVRQVADILKGGIRDVNEISKITMLCPDTIKKYIIKINQLGM